MQCLPLNLSDRRTPGIMDQSHRCAAAVWLRMEGVAALVVSLALYSQRDLGWISFLLLLLIPDISMVGYAAGPRVGATTYNLVHTYVAPALLGGVAYFADRPLLVSVALIWTAHIGLDRMLGYGLKLPTGFQHTHLGVIGGNPAPSRA